LLLASAALRRGRNLDVVSLSFVERTENVVPTRAIRDRHDASGDCPRYSGAARLEGAFNGAADLMLAMESSQPPPRAHR
jgi:hypothetical protein